MITPHKRIFKGIRIGFQRRLNRTCASARCSGVVVSQDDSGDLAELAADLAHQSLARGAVRLAVLLALAEHGLDPGCGHPDQPGRSAVETAMARLAGGRPGSGNLLIEIVLRP